MSENPVALDLDESGLAQGLPRPTDASTPLTVGQPLELYGMAPVGELIIVLTAEVSTGQEARIEIKGSSG